MVEPLLGGDGKLEVRQRFHNGERVVPFGRDRARVILFVRGQEEVQCTQIAMVALLIVTPCGMNVALGLEEHGQQRGAIHV